MGQEACGNCGGLSLVKVGQLSFRLKTKEHCVGITKRAHVCNN